MREAFAAELSEHEHRLLDHLATAAATLEKVAAAVHDQTPRQPATLALDAEILRGRAHLLHSNLVGLAARQAPVAADLRLLLGLIEATHHTTLIANQFRLISEQLILIAPAAVANLGVIDKVSRMCTLAGDQLRQAAVAFHTRDIASAQELDTADDALDKLNREMFHVAVRAALTAEQRELAFRYVLTARCLERVGDNAVDIAEQVVLVMTAELREFSDASQPRRRA